MAKLYNCPLCGENEGYSANPARFGFAVLTCLSCGGSPVKATQESVDPKIYYDRIWNEAAAYAHRMKLGHDKRLEKILVNLLWYLVKLDDAPLSAEKHLADSVVSLVDIVGQGQIPSEFWEIIDYYRGLK